MRADLGRLVAFNRRRSTSVEQVQAYLARLRSVSKGKALLIGQPDDDADRLALAIAERAGALTIEPAVGGKIKVELTGVLDAHKAMEATEIAKQRGWDAYRAVERFVSTHQCRREQLLAHFGDERVPAPTGRCCDVCDPPTWLPDIERAPAPARPRARKSVTPKGVPKQGAGAGAGAGAGDLLEILKEWRKHVAGSNPAYTVAKNATLEDIVSTLPRDEEQLQAISGIGPAFMLKHGQAVLALVSASIK
jgi:ATP-dependent DNA helicase RecQ